MMKCRECVYYKATDDRWGTCYGVRIEGDRDPVTGSDKCRGKYFKPRKSDKGGISSKGGLC